MSRAKSTALPEDKCRSNWPPVLGTGARVQLTPSILKNRSYFQGIEQTSDLFEIRRTPDRAGNTTKRTGRTERTWSSFLRLSNVISIRQPFRFSSPHLSKLDLLTRGFPTRYGCPSTSAAGLRSRGLPMRLCSWRARYELSIG